MTEDQLKEDARLAHEVFDLCGISKTGRGNQPLSLRIRASMLAEKAGVNIALEQEKRRRSNPG